MKEYAKWSSLVIELCTMNNQKRSRDTKRCLKEEWPLRKIGCGFLRKTGEFWAALAFNQSRRTTFRTLFHGNTRQITGLLKGHSIQQGIKFTL